MSWFPPPPLHANFGKNANELFKKKFDYDRVTFKTIRKAQHGLKVESGVVSVFPSSSSADSNNKKTPSSSSSSSSSSYLRAYTKFTLDRLRTQGFSVDSELHTDAKQTNKIEAKFTQLWMPGFVLTVEAANRDPAELFKSSPYVASVEERYTTSNFQVKAQLKTDGQTKSKLNAAASVGYQNWSSGAAVSVDTDTPFVSINNSFSLPDATIDVGGEYTQDDVVASVYSTTETKKGTSSKVVNASYFQRVNRDLVTAGQFKYNVDKRTSTLTVGTDYRLNPTTGLKSKLELPAATASFVLDHRPEVPASLVSLATEWDVSGLHARQAPTLSKFGLSFTFGDF